MAFNFNTKTTEFYAEENMLLHQNYKWDKTGDNGRGDSIGRNLYAYYAYEDHRFVTGVKSCWERIYNSDKYSLQGYRSPYHKRNKINDISRDHVLNTVMLYKMSGLSNQHLQKIVTHLKWKISNFASFTPDLWLYIRAVSGIKYALVLYYIVSFFSLSLALISNKIIYFLAGFKDEVHQNEFKNIPNHKKSKKQMFFRKLLFQTFTVAQVGWQLKLLPNNIFTKLLQRIASGMVLKHNYLLQMLLNCKKQPSLMQLITYKYMKGDRFTTNLNNTTLRDLFILENEYEEEEAKILLKENMLDIDILVKMYNNKASF